MTAKARLDPTLYLVTDPELCRGRALVEIVTSAVRGGVTLVQLRDKHADGRALLEQARQLEEALTPLGVPLIVNDRIDVALAAGVAGAHVGQSDLPPREARALLGPAALLGLSLDRIEQAGVIEPDQLDYIAFGPFATTATKADAGRPVGAAGIATVRAASPLPLVAIGGLDARNAGAAIEAGADGIAVVSSIMAAADPGAAAHELRQTIETARRRSKREQA